VVWFGRALGLGWLVPWRGAGGAALFGRVPPAPTAKLTFCLALVGAGHGGGARISSAYPWRYGTAASAWRHSPKRHGVPFFSTLF